MKTKLCPNCVLPSHVLLDVKLNSEHDNSKNGSNYVCNTCVIMSKGLTCHCEDGLNFTIRQT